VANNGGTALSVEIFAGNLHNSCDMFELQDSYWSFENIKKVEIEVRTKIYSTLLIIICYHREISFKKSLLKPRALNLFNNKSISMRMV